MPTGDRIKKVRIARGLTQKELGEKVSLTDVRIRQYELNNRTPKEDTLRMIAEALDPKRVVMEKKVIGGTHPTEVTRQLDLIEEGIKADEAVLKGRRRQLEAASVLLEKAVNEAIGA